MGFPRIKVVKQNHFYHSHVVRAFVQVIKAIGAAGRSMLDPRRIWVASICVGCLAQGKLGAAQMPLN